MTFESHAVKESDQGCTIMSTKEPPTREEVEKSRVQDDFPIPLHVSYIHRLASQDDELEYWTSEHLRLSGIYWAITALDLMITPSECINSISGELNSTIGRDNITNVEAGGFDRAKVITSVMSCRDPAVGGFGGWKDHDAHLLHTLSAIQILVTVGGLEEALGADGIAQTIAYIAKLQCPDGGFMGDCWGEVDSRFSYCAVSALSLLGGLEAIQMDSCISYVLACRNDDGGFGSVPGAESHSGQIFCCVGALAILGCLNRIDVDQTAWWLAERQLPCGGFNGRPQKLQDVCYSWWVLASLAMLGRQHWIAREPLIQFITRCQDMEAGGFADREEDMTDIFHTLFGIAGLSLLGYGKLALVDPRYCMAKHRLRSVPLGD